MKYGEAKKKAAASSKSASSKAARRKTATGKAVRPPADRVIAPPASEAYERHRERMGEAQSAKSKSARDIAPIPAIVNPDRRQRGKNSYEAFCREYFSQTFNLPWSADHRKAIDKIEQAVLRGGLFAYAMPRGSGKTSLVIAAILWALLYGFRKFAVVIGSDGPSAVEILDAIKSELECNEALYEDFPEACYPIRRLEGIAQRANGQLVNGDRTFIEWTETQIVLPTIDGSECSAGIVRVFGITGRIRGAKFTRPDGQTVRPDVAAVDDPQTDESAKSPNQVKDRERIVQGAVLGLAGPGKEIAGFMPCTVIESDDLADRILDRNTHPKWQGERTKLLYGWPKREDLWESYAKLRSDAQRAGDKDAAAATAFYRANREAMDEGATAAWPARKFPAELSAAQHAMNLYFDLGKASFGAEYQNEPPKKQSEADEALSEDQILAKVDGRPRGIVPLESTKLVSFIDVQKELLFWAVLALQDDFTGHLIDYGTYPDQKREIFAKQNIRRTLSQAESAGSFEQALKSGLDSLASLLLGREWKREDGGVAKIERCPVDAHWGESTDIVKTFCRQSAFSGVLTPSFGMFIGASSLPINDRPAKPGDKIGLNWRQPKPKPGMVRHVAFDANFWKTFLQARLAQTAGGPGCLTLFGDAQDHALLAQHLTAEYPVLTEGRGRKVMEWKVKPSRPDNDWLDCLAGCCVAGSIAGASLSAHKQSASPPRKRVRLSDLQKASGR
jgi:hypothetical protein